MVESIEVPALKFCEIFFCLLLIMLNQSPIWNTT